MLSTQSDQHSGSLFLITGFFGVSLALGPSDGGGDQAPTVVLLTDDEVVKSPPTSLLQTNPVTLMVRVCASGCYHSCFRMELFKIKIEDTNGERSQPGFSVVVA